MTSSDTDLHTFTARYFDGQTARAWTVTVAVAPRGLTLTSAEDSRGGFTRAFWPSVHLRLLEPAEDGRPAVFTNAVQAAARIVVSHPADAERVVDVAGLSTPGHSWLKTDWRTLAGWSAAAVVFLIVMTFAIPHIAVVAAPFVPQGWRDQLGQYARDALTADHRECTAPAGRAALDALVQRLETGASIRGPLTVTVTDSPVTNAHAFPGGTIIVFNGLINAVDEPDELAAALAHEMGHVKKEHPTVAMIRSLGLAVAVRGMLSGFDAGIAGKIANLYDLTYSRQMELEADRIAMNILIATEIDSGALKGFFERMARSAPGLGALKYLSTHPDWRERMAAVQPPPGGAGAVRPALNDNQWNDLKAICDTPDSPKRRSTHHRQEARL